MSGIIIREIKSKEIQSYKEFFNSALIRDEESFRISPADEVNASFPTKDAADSFTLCAYSGDAMAGIVSFERDGINREKLRHKGILFRMYVALEFRGSGISKMLIQELLKKVERLSDIEQINLTVVSNNHKAKKLYEQFGFKTFAIESNALKWKGKYFDEEQMALTWKKI